MGKYRNTLRVSLDALETWANIGNTLRVSLDALETWANIGKVLDYEKIFFTENMRHFSPADDPVHRPPVLVGYAGIVSADAGIYGVCHRLYHLDRLL